ncbi:MAG: PDZ domain-containing protein, partial [Clostridia bacterium]|nr:PDZ domain-containing protein [Clostridia bacterium]
MKRYYFSLGCLVLLCVITLSILVPIQTLNQLDGGFIASYEDVDTANQNRTFGSFIKSELTEKEKSVDGQKTKQGEIVFKLFGFIPIKKVGVVMANDDDYFVGGKPIGLSILTDGAIVISDENEDKTPLKEGDIITKIDGQSVKSLNEVQEFLQNETKEQVEVEYMRKNKPFNTLIKVKKDDLTGKLKLGLWVKDDVTGVGTLTFVNKNNYKYSALGHPIVEGSGGNVIPIADGDIYECNLIGINKGEKNDPGELKCVFSSNSKSKGSIENNCKFGINGVLNSVEGLVDENVTAKLGGRLSVKMGDAKIVSCVS